MNTILKNCLLSTVLIAACTSCTKKLDRLPNNGIFIDSVYNSPAGYKASLAKVYSSFAITGINGPGSTDLSNIDAGLSDFLRMYWDIQELGSDEALCAWVNDPGIFDLDNMTWNGDNKIMEGLYNRCMYQITIANSFIKQCNPSVVASHGITGADADEIKHYLAEARYIRAYQYWVMMDLYGNPPFVTDADTVGILGNLPKQIKRTDLFTYVESELKAIEPDLVAARQNEYGRADQGADWALLARMYLNAEVYTGTAHWADALTYAQKVIDAGYALKTNYKELFYADNNVNNPESIFTINYDLHNTQSYGGTTFIVNGSINGDMNPTSFGVPGGGWGGNRAKQNLPNLFSDLSGNSDTRALFFGDDKVITDITKFTQGIATEKFRNINSDGTSPKDAGVFSNVDFPIFRLAEMYLIYDEANLRGGGGDNLTAVNYFNLIRERAYGNTNGNVGTIALEDILDEKGREFYWEACRRTDLIRFGKYTSASYLWPFKGGVSGGTGVDSHLQLCPIPATDLIANSNMQQNPGY